MSYYLDEVKRPGAGNNSHLINRVHVGTPVPAHHAGKRPQTKGLRQAIQPLVTTTCGHHIVASVRKTNCLIVPY